MIKTIDPNGPWCLLPLALVPIARPVAEIADSRWASYSNCRSTAPRVSHRIDGICRAWVLVADGDRLETVAAARARPESFRGHRWAVVAELSFRSYR
jgi:hypothetical protein